MGFAMPSSQRDPGITDVLIHAAPSSLLVVNSPDNAEAPEVADYETQTFPLSEGFMMTQDGDWPAEIVMVRADEKAAGKRVSPVFA